MVFVCRWLFVENSSATTNDQPGTMKNVKLHNFRCSNFYVEESSNAPSLCIRSNCLRPRLDSGEALLGHRSDRANQLQHDSLRVREPHSAAALLSEGRTDHLARGDVERLRVRERPVR